MAGLYNTMVKKNTKITKVAMLNIRMKVIKPSITSAASTEVPLFRDASLAIFISYLNKHAHAHSFFVYLTNILALV